MTSYDLMSLEAAKQLEKIERADSDTNARDRDLILLLWMRAGVLTNVDLQTEQHSEFVLCSLKSFDVNILTYLLTTLIYVEYMHGTTVPNSCIFPFFPVSSKLIFYNIVISKSS